MDRLHLNGAKTPGNLFMFYYLGMRLELICKIDSLLYDFLRFVVAFSLRL